VNKPTAVVIGVGAERGLGAALCQRFAGERYHLIVAGRTPEKIAQVVQTIRKAGGSGAGFSRTFCKMFIVLPRPESGNCPCSLP
jgi:NAD(P)-dependent dehydrogenase (short-subunit alcohol dehydrogenase family)